VHLRHLPRLRRVADGDGRALREVGLGPPGRARVVGHGGGCERTTELVLSVGGYATCAECGTTQQLEPFPH
jgi:hypothetical protein